MNANESSPFVMTTMQRTMGTAASAARPRPSTLSRPTVPPYRRQRSLSPSPPPLDDGYDGGFCSAVHACQRCSAVCTASFCSPHCHRFTTLSDDDTWESPLHHVYHNAAAGPDAAEPMEAADSPSPAAAAGEKQREGSRLKPAEAADDDEALLRCAEAAEAGAAAAAATPHLSRVVHICVHHPFVTICSILAAHLAYLQVQQRARPGLSFKLHGRSIGSCQRAMGQLTRHFPCEQKQESGAELATPASAAASNSGMPAVAAAPLFADTPAGPAQPSGWDDVYEGADDGGLPLRWSLLLHLP